MSEFRLILRAGAGSSCAERSRCSRPRASSLVAHGPAPRSSEGTILHRLRPRRRLSRRSGSSSRKASRAARWRSGSERCGGSRSRTERDPAFVERRLPRGKCARQAAGRVPQGLGGQVGGGFPLPGDVRVHEVDPVGAAGARPARDVPRGVGAREPPYAKSKNLTPYDVLIIASMIEKETVAPEERRLVSAVIFNRLRERMVLGIDATIRYRRNIRGPSRSGNPTSRSSTRTTRGGSRGCRRRRSRTPGSRRSGPLQPGARRLPLLRPQAGQGASLLHGERGRARGEEVRVRVRVLSARL